ncbi:putative inorganic phosphate cotransporter, partial [Musca vetustissima]|uniref:putative inorganic phosphate cotransporter n=1 Tax=Musca vetustissima TaxID=27455 RepID=UPI002AB773B1
TTTATPSIPWRSIMTSVPLWAILITQCGQSWAFYTQLTELPTYMNNILHFEIQSNAVLNSVPYLTSWLVGIGCSAVADWMLERRYISTLNSYKFWNSIASIIPSLGMIGVGYVGCSWQWVTFMLAGVGSFAGAIYPGNQMNHISLSPSYAGTMYGITNSAANICGFLAPYVIGLIINHNETMLQWRKVFWLAGGLNIAGNLIYLIFASADEQSWSRPENQQIENNHERSPRRRNRREVNDDNEITT